MVGIAQKGISDLKYSDNLCNYWHTYRYWRRVRLVTPEVLRKLYVHNLRKLSDMPAVILDDNNYLILKKRQFDSEFFNKNIWKIEAFICENAKKALTILRESEHFFKDNRIDFVTIDIDSASINLSHALHRAGFYFAASKITNFAYTFRNSRVRFSKNYFKIINPDEIHIPEIKRLSRENMNVSTIGNDPHFPEEVADGLYPVWIEKACKKEWADKVYIALRGEEIKGYLSIRFDRDFEEITGKRISDDSGLAFSTVDGKGSYVNLLDSSISDFDSDIYGFAIECNSDNHEVLRYCAARGFPQTGNKLTFHKALR